MSADFRKQVFFIYLSIWILDIPYSQISKQEEKNEFFPNGSFQLTRERVKIR